MKTRHAQHENASRVEAYFLQRAGMDFLPRTTERIPVITVPNYVVLGQLAALRFIEWVIGNPEGVVALPTGKTPEYFIKWFAYYKRNWSRERSRGLLAKIGIATPRPPSCRGLHFVQIDEFFPLDPAHDRSFNRYVRAFYLQGFGFDPERALLIDTFTFPPQITAFCPPKIRSLQDAFGGNPVDFSLRFRQPLNERELLLQHCIRHFDFFCQEYEERIRSLGGIGFFLGGLGPDGHVAFNIRGSSHYSITRLTTLNYESMAAGAQDLGGIETVRTKAVVTIGLGTITFNPDVVAILFAAGQAKSGVVAAAVCNAPHTDFPATALQKLPHARCFLTAGAASQLFERSVMLLRRQGAVAPQTVERLVVRGALEARTRLADLATTRFVRGDGKHATLRLAAELSKKPDRVLAAQVSNAISAKIERGLSIPNNERFLHTGPHHDDIELGYFPLIHHLVRSPSNVNHFCYLTSGFTSVTNSYVIERLEGLRGAMLSGMLLREISTRELANPGKREPEINGYLNAIASQNRDLQNLFASARLARDSFQYLGSGSKKKLLSFVDSTLELMRATAAGAPDPVPVRQIKSWIREWEADTVWSHFGLAAASVSHLRLKFYTGEIFPDDPQFSRDGIPLVELLETVRPTIITLALDPEGSGPDTHYKCLIALRAAIDAYARAHGEGALRVWGYRNVWSRFDLSEADLIVPVSLNSFAVLHSMFDSCFVSQRSASFPSFELDGTFSHLAQKIWVEQFAHLTTLLGKSYFFESDHPMMKRAHGAIYLKEMTVPGFMKATEGLDRLASDKRALARES